MNRRQFPDKAQFPLSGLIKPQPGYKKPIQLITIIPNDDGLNSFP